jgi:hypothetical protein
MRPEVIFELRWSARTPLARPGDAGHDVPLPNPGSVIAIAVVFAAGTATAIFIVINIDAVVTFDTVVTNFTGAGRRSARRAGRRRRLCRRRQQLMREQHPKQRQ